MRKLKTTDVFKACRLIKKMGVKESVESVLNGVSGSDGELSIESVGVKSMYAIFDCVTDVGAEKAWYDFLSGPFEMSAEDVENMDLSELIDNLKTLVKENNLQVFLKALQGMMRTAF